MPPFTQSQVVLGLVAGGALVLLFAALRTRRVFRLVSETSYRRRWQSLFGLMVLFLFGYVGTIFVLYSGYEGVLELLTGTVFLAGAVFVLLVVDTGRETIAEVESLREETESLNSHLEEKADDYRDVMRDCRDGDLTRRMDPDSQNEAMTDIATEFNAMMDTVEATVDDLTLFADEVTTYSREITMSADEVESESERVAESMEEITAKAQRQNENLQEASAEMNALLTTIGEISESSDEVAEIAELTVETGREGREAAEDAIEGMRDVEEEAAQTVAEMEQLEAQVQQIDELTDFISEIAEQTNMLALNANIEANRDGESGGGFAAVANEVKQLAAGTKQAAADIEERLDDIQTETSQTVEAVRVTSDRIADHTESVENAVEALDEITSYARETNQGVQAIDRATDRQSQSTQDAAALVESAAVAAEETSTESSAVTDAANAQAAALGQVTDGTEILARQAAQLRDTLDQFEVDAADADRSLGTGDGDAATLPGDDVAPDGQSGDVLDDVYGGAADEDAGQAGDGTGDESVETNDERADADGEQGTERAGRPEGR